jgi:hypothetical protein
MISCDVAGAQKAIGVFEKGPKAGTPEMETEPMNTNIIQSWIAESERMLRSGGARHGLKTRVTVQLALYPCLSVFICGVLDTQRRGLDEFADRVWQCPVAARGAGRHGQWG